MKAMVLAAGLGTRLRPLTNDRPKALVEIDGKTLLEITLARLLSAGVSEVIVNTHHFADKVEAFLRSRSWGMRVEISREETLLDTGGGLKQAAWFFLEPGKDETGPFLLHNVDVLSTINLVAMARAHRERGALATLAVQDRATSRPLLFDEHEQLCGRRVGSADPELVGPVKTSHALAFAGIHVLSPEIFAKLTEEGVFPVVPAYLRLAAQGERILAYRADNAYWRDLGKPENVKQAEQDVRGGIYSA